VDDRGHYPQIHPQRLKAGHELEAVFIYGIGQFVQGVISIYYLHGQVVVFLPKCPDRLRKCILGEFAELKELLLDLL
jgi:hypothetical protein